MSISRRGWLECEERLPESMASWSLPTLRTHMLEMRTFASPSGILSRVLNPQEFEVARLEICASGPPSDGDNLLGMEMDFCAYLGDPAFANEDPGLWAGMSVWRAEGTDWLVRGAARSKRSLASEISTFLAGVWTENLRYEHREEHVVTMTPDEVSLRAVTQAAPSGLWVTALVQIELGV